MKTNILWKWSLAAALAVLPFLGCGQRAVTEGSPSIALSQEVAATDSDLNAPPPETGEQNLENAPAQVVAPAQAPANTLSASAAEIVKLAQAGVDEGVMLTYVTNSAAVFNLTADDIVYLNDVGVPSVVATAMLQHDQAVKSLSGNSAVASGPPVYTNQLVPTPGAPTPYATAPSEIQAEPTTVIQNPEPVAQVNVSYTYFYDTLSPYGTWINVDGYGMCWQPTVVVVNRDWQPYCDRGHWVYSDCGWYWTSDYSWGWAPFHYGRWFRHSRMGWCWAPDTVWGPSWVTWRYSSDYCGWAPLPPSACFLPGIGFTYYGRSVGVNFSFGLTSRHYAFVPVRNFYDRHPGHYRLREHNVTQIYNHTTIVHQYDRGDRDRIINRGIPIEHVRAATHSEIRPVAIRDTDRPGNTRILQRGDQQHGRTLDVFRPPMPQPVGSTRFVGEGVRPATRQSIVDRDDHRPRVNNDRAMTPAATPTPPARETIRARDRDGREQDNRRNETAPVIRNTPAPSVAAPSAPAAGNPKSGNTTRDNRTSPAIHGRDPIILRGPGRTSPIESPRGSDGARNVSPQTHNYPTPMPRELTQPSVPAAPVQNNPAPVISTPPTRQFTPAPATPNVRPTFQTPQQNQRIIRQEAPATRPNRAFTQPAAPIQRQEIAPRSERIQTQPPMNSIERRAPRIESQPAPRIETRSAPPAQPRSAPAPNSGASARGSDSDRQDGNGNRRNR